MYFIGFSVIFLGYVIINKRLWQRLEDMIIEQENRHEKQSCLFRNFLAEIESELENIKEDATCLSCIVSEEIRELETRLELAKEIIRRRG